MEDTATMLGTLISRTTRLSHYFLQLSYMVDCDQIDYYFHINSLLIMV